MRNIDNSLFNNTSEGGVILNNPSRIDNMQRFTSMRLNLKTKNSKVNNSGNPKILVNQDVKVRDRNKIMDERRISSSDLHQVSNWIEDERLDKNRSNTFKDKAMYTWRIWLADGDYNNEEENIEDPLVSPCNWAGTMKYIHLNCLRSWLDSK